MPTGRGIWENLIAGLLVVAVLAGATWGISHVDAPVPLWALFLVATAIGVIGFGLGRVWGPGDDLLAYQADLLGEAILALREVITGKINLPFEEFIERGVLAPARYGLSLQGGEEIRLSVLVPDADGHTFRMLYEAGHSLGRKGNFSLPKASLAGHALETGEMQWTNNVETDRRWHRHPKASAERSYNSLASMPIVVGDDAVAVLNVVSSVKGAFLKGDLTYIELLAGFIGLAWALNDQADSPHTLSPSRKRRQAERKGN